MNIKTILNSYDPKKITIATIGSHSALDICRGAKDEGFQTLVICQKGREKTYAEYFKYRDKKGIVDQVIILDSFADLLKPSVQDQIRTYNAIFIPHRSLFAYLQGNYDAIENELAIPFFGNKYLLKVEERTGKHNQYALMQKARIRTPKIFDHYQRIDRLCLVKIPEKQRSFERSFFFCSNPTEFEQNTQKKIDNHEIDQAIITKMVIEEYIIGPYINFNYFYSPMSQELELLGTDTRRQTNIDGFLHLTAMHQMALPSFTPKFEEAGHIAVTVLESMLEDAFAQGERLIETARSLYNPGIIGPFALQAAIVPGPPKKEIVVFDLSLRMPGSPGIMFTPYSYYLHGFPVSAGRRIAMEIKQALQENRLAEIVT